MRGRGSGLNSPTVASFYPGPPRGTARVLVPPPGVALVFLFPPQAHAIDRALAKGAAPAQHLQPPHTSR